MIIKFKKLSENATIPTKSHENDAGFDFYSPCDINIIPNASIKIPLDIAWEPTGMPQFLNSDIELKGGEYSFMHHGVNIYLQIKGRSGLAMKHCIEICNAGVVDFGFRGNITIRLYNWGKSEYFISKGDRIAQGIVHLIPSYSIEEAKELSDSKRGIKGLGSSGK